MITVSRKLLGLVLGLSVGVAGASAAGCSTTSDDTQDDPRRHEPPSRKPVKKTRGRASVPSWDEIMFGGPDSDPG